MSQGPRNRRARRNLTPPASIASSRYALHGPLRLLTSPKLFAAASLIFGVGILLSLLLGGIIRGPTLTGSSAGPLAQGNEAPDVPQAVSESDESDAVDGSDETAVASSSPVAINQYSEPPTMTIDMGRRYLATIETDEGEFTLELYTDEAPLAVNAFIFLAREGYYDGTPFMQLVRNPDGSPFAIQAGDPTRTGLGTPGFSVAKELTTRPFERGAIGMGGAAENSNGGQFFISLGDYPALDGKYTIFGRVVSGLDVLDSLLLLDLTSDGSPGGTADEIQEITIAEK